jgi:DNA-binding transcriptional LysR family regulator
MTAKRPSFRQLEALGAVIDTGSITRAAARLHVSQPALSRLIASLEADVGYAMFRRAGGRVVPTAEAALLRDQIEEAMGAVDRVRRRALQLGKLTDGQLTVGASPWMAATLLPLLLARFHASHPKLLIALNGMSFHRLLEAVAAQRADFAISDLPPHTNGVVAEHLCRYPAVCITQPSHRFAALARVPLSAFKNERFILLRDEDERQPTITRAFQDSAVELSYPIEVTLVASACAWVAAAGGCAIVDPFSAGEWRDQLVYLETDPPIWFDLWIIRPESRPLTRLASDFLALLRESLPSALSRASPTPRRKRT